MKFVTYGIPKKEPFIIENCDQENKDDDDAADDVLGMMFHSPKFSDITFIVGNYKKEFKAHKNVLAIRVKTLSELALEDVDEDEDCLIALIKLLSVFLILLKRIWRFFFGMYIQKNSNRIQNQKEDATALLMDCRSIWYN